MYFLKQNNLDLDSAFDICPYALPPLALHVFSFFTRVKPNTLWGGGEGGEFI